MRQSLVILGLLKGRGSHEFELRTKTHEILEVLENFKDDDRL